MRSDAMKRQFAIHGELFRKTDSLILNDQQTTNELKRHYRHVTFATEKMTRHRKLLLSLREHGYIYRAL